MNTNGFPTHLTPGHIDTFLDSYRLALESVTELAQDWHEMEEFEKLHFRQDFTHAFGLRRTIGALYGANRLTQTQIMHLTALDRLALALAADLETVYEVSLHQLLDNLFHWGTPLSQQTGMVQITITVPALLKFAGITPAPIVDQRVIA